MKIYRPLLIVGVLLLVSPSAAFAAFGDISNWVYNIATQVPALIKLLVAIAYISGFGFLIGAMYKFKECAQSTTMMSQQHSISGPLIYLFVAAVLLYFAGFVQIGSMSLFGQDSTLAYQASSTVSVYSNIIAPILLILRLIGYMAFLKGIFLLARLSGSQAQPGTLAKAVVHIVGGIMAINIEATYNLLLNTLIGTPGIG